MGAYEEALAAKLSALMSELPSRLSPAKLVTGLRTTVNVQRDRQRSVCPPGAMNADNERPAVRNPRLIYREEWSEPLAVRSLAATLDAGVTWQ
jgi:hypothetical protein